MPFNPPAITLRPACDSSSLGCSDRYRVLPAPRRGSAPQLGHSSLPWAAKRANPRSSPRSAFLLDSHVHDPQRSPSPIAGRHLPVTILSGAWRIAPKDRSGTGASAAPPLLPISTIPITSIRSCQLRNAIIAIETTSPAIAQLDPLHAPTPACYRSWRPYQYGNLLMTHYRRFLSQGAGAG
jgi:hypothetical protein